MSTVTEAPSVLRMLLVPNAVTTTVADPVGDGMIIV